MEAVLWEWLRQLLTDNTLQQAAQRYQERLRAHGEQDRRTEVVHRLAAVENEIKFNVRAARAGTLPEDMLEAENAPLVKEREDLQRELERLERTSRLPDRDAEELLAMGRTALDRWETLEDAGRKLDFLERVFTHVELWGDRMRIHHALDPLEPKDVALPTYWAPKRGVTEVDLDAAT